MAEKLMVQSIVSDNRITAQFSDKSLPRYARHGELYVVNGLLYIFTDLDNSGHGKWFPLTDEKEIYTYEQTVKSQLWDIDIDFQTDNIQIIVYDHENKLYLKDFELTIAGKDDLVTSKIQIAFAEEVRGQAYIIVNKTFDWMDKRLVVADRRFAVTENPDDINQYFIEIDTEYVEILKNGNVTLEKDINIKGSMNVEGDTTYSGSQNIEGDLTVGGNFKSKGTIVSVNDLIAQMNVQIQNDLIVGGNTTINGDLTVKGITTTVDTEEIKLADNIITLNSNAKEAIENAGIEVERGTEDNKVIIQWQENTQTTNIPNNTIIDGVTTLKSDLLLEMNGMIDGNLTVDGDTHIKSNVIINGTLQIDSDTNIDGNLTISGNDVNISTTTLNVNDNIVTLNKGTVGTPAENVGIEIDRGDEGLLPLVTFNESDDKVVIPVLQQNGTFIQDEIAGKIYTLDEIEKEKGRAVNIEQTIINDLNTEISNREDADNVLTTNLNTEISNREDADTTLQANIDNEVTRAKASEQTIKNDLNTEISNREEADTILQTNIDNEVTRAKDADNVLTTNLNTEISNREEADNVLTTNLNTEISNREEADNVLTTNLNTEISNREEADNVLTTNLNTEISNREEADATIQTNIDSEVTRAKTVEGDLTELTTSNTDNLVKAINSIKSTVDTNDTTLQTNIDNETTRATNKENELSDNFKNYISNISTTNQEINSDLTINESVIIKKDLTVEGTTTTVNTTETEVDDNKIILNSSVTEGEPTQDASLVIRRGDEGDNTIIKWYENGNSSEVQISVWDDSTSQFILQSVSTKDYTQSKVSDLNTVLSTRVDDIETTLTTKNDNNTESIDNEVARATNVEGDLTELTTTNTDNLVKAINSEVDRAISKDDELKTSIDNEIDRAISKDNELKTSIDNEIDRAISKDNELKTSIDNEVARATNVEGDLSELSTNSNTTLVDSINSLKIEVDTNNIDNTKILSDMFVKDGEDIKFKGNLIPNEDNKFNIGSSDNKIKELFVSANTIYLGDNTIIGELGLQLAGNLNATELTATTVTASNLYDKTTVDTKITGVETELTSAIGELETAHNILVSTVASDTLSKTQTTSQSVSGNITFSKDISVQGNLNVVGTQTTTDIVKLAVEKNEIIMNDGTEGSPYLNASLRVDRGDLGIQNIISWKELGENSSVQIPIIQEDGTIVDDDIVTKTTLTDIIDTSNSILESTIQTEITTRIQKNDELKQLLIAEINRAKEIEGTLDSLSSKLLDSDGNTPKDLVFAINKTLSITNSSINNIKSLINDEIQRATDNEQIISDSLTSEINKSKNKEKYLETLITDEAVRAKDNEATIRQSVITEKNRAQGIETALTDGLNSEITRAQNVESELQTSISNILSTMSSDSERLEAINKLTTAFTEADDDLSLAISTIGSKNANDIIAEQNRAENIENNILSNLNIEIDRAKSVEGILIQLKTKNQSNLVDSLNELYDLLVDETTRAKDVEKVLTDNLNTEISDRETADSGLDTRITNVENQVNGNIGDLGELTTDDKDTIVGSINEVDANLNTEISDRETADTTLQTNINNLENNIGTFDEFKTAFAENS